MRSALIAVAVFGLLLAFVFATRETGTVNVGVPKLEFAAVDPAKVTLVELSGAQSLTLKKDAAGWTVADEKKVFHPADEGKVRSLLEGFKDLKAEAFVTEKAEKLAELEVDDVKGLKVVVTRDGAPPLGVVFGKAGKQGGNYVRAPGKNQVFITNSRLAIDAKHQAVWWRQRSIRTAALGDLQSVTVTHADGTALPLEAKPEGTWALGAAASAPPKFRFDPAAAQRVAATFTALWAADFLDQVEGDPFAAPHVTVEGKTKDGKTVRAHLGAPAANGVPLKVEGDPQAYVVSADQAGQLQKRLADLADTTLLQFDPAKATRLVLQTGAKKTVLAKDGAAWKVLEPKALPAGADFDPGQVPAELARLSRLRGDAVTDAKTVGKTAGSVEVTVEGGPAQRLEFGGDAPPTGVLVKGSADGRVYSVAKAELTRLESPFTLFKRPPAPPAGPQKQLRLEDLPPDIRAKLEAQLRQQQQQPQ